MTTMMTTPGATRKKVSDMKSNSTKTDQERRRENFMPARTKSNEPAPAPQDPLVGRFELLQGVMIDTGASIPRLLAEQRDLGQELGRCEITGENIEATKARLDSINSALASAARQRSSASEGLLAMNNELRAARAAATQSLQQVAQLVISDFGMRWDSAVAALAKLHAEASALSRIGIPVQPSPPYVAGLSPDGSRWLVNFIGQVVEDVPLPEQVTQYVTRIGQIDSALALCAAVVQSVELNESHLALSRIRQGLPAQMTGTFEVLRPFDFCGSNFAVGSLVSRHLLLDGVLYRYWLAKCVQPLAGAALAA
jgi:hypothetical protein